MRQIKEAEEEVAQAEQDYEDNFPDECPLCGRSE
jgi:hypothetical protein